MARKSSFVRFGKEYLGGPGEGKGGGESEKPPEETPEKQPVPPAGGVWKFLAVVLFVVCVALAVGLLFSTRSAGEARTRFARSNDTSSLYLNAVAQYNKGDFADARESFKKALSMASEYQADAPDSFMAALIEDIERNLARPAIARGESGARAQKWTDLRDLVAQLEPADIYLQLGQKAGPILDEHVRRMNLDDVAKLLPEHIDKLVDKKVAELDEKELASRLGEKLDAVFQERLSAMTAASLRLWLKDRLAELVRVEIERRQYDVDAMNELLGERRGDIVRAFIERAETKDIAEIVEPRFDDIEREMAKTMEKRQARITLDDGATWEGQILHEGPLNMRFLRSDGGLFSIPNSRIKKKEPMLQPREPTEEPNKEDEKPEPESPPPSEE